MSLKRQKVLIIKIGYSETLDPTISNVTSYGDVLRTTVLLNLYRQKRISWLVDENSYPILKNNPYIRKPLVYNPDSISQLKSERFDTIINLEKVPELCKLADQIAAKRRYGFRFSVKKGKVEAHEGTKRALSICRNKNEKRNHNRYWQEHLFEIAGAKWRGEEYIFGYKPKETDLFDVGFNFKVGNKWPIKAWPMKNWKRLEKLLKKEFSVSWQEGLYNMEEYFEWINKCKLIVTNDSFGLHLAIALRKKVVALFGPTNPDETYLYERGAALTPKNARCPYFPCYSQMCKKKSGPCISRIKPEAVYCEICRML